MINRVVFSIALALIGATSATAASAINSNVAALIPLPVSDMKTYHGSQCEAYYHQDIPGVQNRREGTHISSSLATWITCPIVRDNTINTNGTLGVDVYIRNVAGQKYECYLISQGTHAAPVWVDPEATVAGGNQTLILDVNNSANAGSFNLECKLPRGAWLFGYRVREYSNPGAGTANSDNNN